MTVDARMQDEIVHSVSGQPVKVSNTCSHELTYPNLAHTLDFNTSNKLTVFWWTLLELISLFQYHCFSEHVVMTGSPGIEHLCRICDVSNSGYLVDLIHRLYQRFNSSRYGLSIAICKCSFHHFQNRYHRRYCENDPHIVLFQGRVDLL